jgi:hypothetical protein
MCVKTKLKTYLGTALASALLFTSISHVASASVLLQGWANSGESGFGQIAMPKNDDDSSREFTFDEFGELGFDSGVNFFGQTYNSYFINNNGNLTFESSLSTFTPNPFPQSDVPMIAPFWGDVDTRCDACGNVYLGSPDENTLVVTWDSVGKFNEDSSETNTFQLVMIDRADTGAGNFDVEFRYDNIDWVSGSASDGIPAQAGYDAGDGVNFFTVPGSRTSEVANLDTAPSNTGTNGLWRFAIRDGALPGSTPDNPILPTIDPNNPTNYNFEFEIIDPDEFIFIDPLVAIGYDYIVNSGPNLAAVILPTGFDDNLFDLWLWDDIAMDWVDANTVITGGVEYEFSSPVDRFRILGIDIANMLDPADFTAFVTGLRFDSVGTINMSQNAIVFDTDIVIDANAPSILVIMLSGIAFMFVRRKKLI